MRIYGLLEDLMGCGYHRVLAPLTAIPPGQAEVRVSHHIPDNPAEWDILQAQKFTMPVLMPWLRQIKKNGRPKFVMDLDDDLFRVPDHNAAHDFYTDSEINRNLKESIKRADALTVTTQYLAGIVAAINPSAPIGIFPNQVNQRHIQPLKWQRFSVGWAGGNSHLKDIQSMVPSLTKFMEKRNHRLTLIGQDYTNLFPGVRTRFYPWQSYDNYMRLLREKISVGLAPVDTDEFNLGKSDIKLVEYAASGVFPVYSLLPPYYDSLVRGIGVGPNSWETALNVLVEDEQKLNMMISQAYNSVKARTHERTWPERMKFYRKVVKL